MFRSRSRSRLALLAMALAVSLGLESPRVTSAAALSPNEQQSHRSGQDTMGGAATGRSIVSVSSQKRSVPHDLGLATAATPGNCCFSDNCVGWSLEPDGHTLSATCWSKRDQRHWVEVNTSLDLDYCLLNGDGELIPQYQ